MLPFELETLRLTLHLLSVSVWIGGQILLAALVPVLREVSPEATKKAAQRFGQVAWPFFGLAVLTGIWNLLEVESGQSSQYMTTLGLKLVLVTSSGVAAFVHSRTGSVAVRGATGAIGLLSALGALVLGVML